MKNVRLRKRVVSNVVSNGGHYCCEHHHYHVKEGRIMKFNVVVDYISCDYKTEQHFDSWASCRGFLLVLTDCNKILIRDIAESLLNVGVYEHRDKWYALKVACKHDVTIGEALHVIGSS